MRVEDGERHARWGGAHTTAVVAALLNTFNSFKQTGPLSERQSPTHIHLGRQEVNCVTACKDRTLNIRSLVGNGPEAVAVRVPSTDVADPQDPGPEHGRELYRANATHSTRGCVSPSGVLA